MISTSNVGLQFGSRHLFKDVNVTFSAGNCYGLIGANGSGKSTFLKILSGQIESTTGRVDIKLNSRVSFLQQDQFAYDECIVRDVVIMGYQKLYKVIKEKGDLYAKADFSDSDGNRAAELEEVFAELDGWNSESDAEKLLDDLGLSKEQFDMKMKNLEASQKVRVLLAQALFGNPDILLLDEPTNQLNIETCMWLEDFLANFENLAIVVSHDRHFLDQVCTNIADIDYGKIQIYAGNYTFWKEASELALQQRHDKNKKSDEKKKDLESFISRFSANASKSKQATARKKVLEKLKIDDIKPSSRKYPFVGFDQEREVGNDILDVVDLEKGIEGGLIFGKLCLSLNKGDKICFLGHNDLAKTILFQTLMGEVEPDKGNFKWGISTQKAYLPKDNNKFFESDKNLIDWLRQYSDEKDENFVRGFLGRMLFSGEETFKLVKVLSGGERVRCMLSRMMLMKANVLILDEPTNHLDLESISALNEGLRKYKGNVLFSSHDHQFIQTVANRIVEITPKGIIDRPSTTLDEYLVNRDIIAKRAALYS